MPYINDKKYKNMGKLTGNLISKNNFNYIFEIDNIYIGKCYSTFHAFIRFKNYLCKRDNKLYNKSDKYFIDEFIKVFSVSKKGQIKNYHNVIRLINNNYETSNYLFNHSSNLRFVVVEKNKNIVTCEPIRS